MVEGKWLPPGADIGPALFLRHEIFALGPDNMDAYAWQVLAINDGMPVATGRIWWEDGAFFIGMIGVLPAFRGQGFGDFTTRLLLFKAQQHNAVKVMLYAKKEAEPFFRRFGFEIVPGHEANGLSLLELNGGEILVRTCEGV
jgi:ribosomal protein S18 acetylase RimI-like enzyme